MRIGFIGQGYIGKNYADDFEKRGVSVVRYSLEEAYVGNKNAIKECDIVFIAVPTPTRHALESNTAEGALSLTDEGKIAVTKSAVLPGFDASIVDGALSLVGDGKIAVIKSTILPGTTAALQRKHKNITVLYSPEFLSEATAAQDASTPFSNIVGLSVDDVAHRAAAYTVLGVLPKAPFVQICTSNEAEMIKYSHNMNGYFQIMLSNILFDAATAIGADWANVEKALKADPYITNRYTTPVHKSGRGAGGHCFIKDFAAFRQLYTALLPDDTGGRDALIALEKKNRELLRASGKDIELLEGVYGKQA